MEESKTIPVLEVLPSAELPSPPWLFQHFQASQYIALEWSPAPGVHLPMLNPADFLQKGTKFMKDKYIATV